MIVNYNRNVTIAIYIEISWCIVQDFSSSFPGLEETGPAMMAVRGDYACTSGIAPQPSMLSGTLMPGSRHCANLRRELRWCAVLTLVSHAVTTYPLIRNRALLNLRGFDYIPSDKKKSFVEFKRVFQFVPHTANLGPLQFC